MLHSLLSNVPPWLIILLVVFGAVLTTVAYLIFLERKIASWVQDRIGPNRVGPWGLLQSMADGLKMFLKEDYRPKRTDGLLFSLAPCLMMAVIVAAMAVLPWGGIVQGTVMQSNLNSFPAQPAGSEVIGTAPTADPTVTEVTYRYSFQIADINIGVLYIIALLSLAVYGVVLGGWSSNNKFSFLGGMRAAAQMVSYEIPLGLSLLTVVVMFGTLSLGDITAAQAHYWNGWIPAWNVFSQPLAFLMFLVCIHAEANRAPFDLAECEQELVGGFHTEYSSMRFGLFFLGEYTGMVITSAVLVALFLGGWHFPGLVDHTDPANPAVTSSLGIAILRSLVFFGKTLLIISVFMWVRWSLPRFRFDQLMQLAWRGFIPIALAIFIGTVLVLYAFRAGTVIDGDSVSATMLSKREGWRQYEGLALLLMNVVILMAILAVAWLKPAPKAPNRRIAVPSHTSPSAA